MSSPRRVLVSGGTNGIGLACGRYLAARGDHVWALGTTAESVAGAKAEVALAGAGVCDVSQPEQVRQAVAEAVSSMGGLEGVFINAGIDGQGRPALELELGHFRRVLEVNVLGAFLVAQAALALDPRPRALVFNASVNAVRPELDFLDYNASKAAVVSMAKSLALEVSAQGTAVTALCPGYFPTRMTAPYLDDPVTRAQLLARVPAGRFGELSEIGALVSFLLSEEAFFMTGSVVSIDGGASI